VCNEQVGEGVCDMCVLEVDVVCFTFLRDMWRILLMVDLNFGYGVSLHSNKGVPRSTWKSARERKTVRYGTSCMGFLCLSNVRRTV